MSFDRVSGCTDCQESSTLGLSPFSYTVINSITISTLPFKMIFFRSYQVGRNIMSTVRPLGCRGFLTETGVHFPGYSLYCQCKKLVTESCKILLTAPCQILVTKACKKVLDICSYCSRKEGIGPVERAEKGIAPADVCVRWRSRARKEKSTYYIIDVGIFEYGYLQRRIDLGGMHCIS